MADVFISYSRKDIAFARLIHQCFEASQLSTWIDWQDIPPGEDWLKEVYTAIEQADTFLFIISQTSVSSNVCKQEITHAQENHKRIIPVIVHDLGANAVNEFFPSLSALNWIFFLDGREFKLTQVPQDAGDGPEMNAIPKEPQFRNAMRLLTQAIQVDQAWLRAHTRLQVRALEWERNGHDASYFLHGKDLEQAEAWLGGAAGKDPQPSPIQAQYILASRQSASRRQRMTFSAVLLGLVLAIGLGIFAWISRGEAVSQSNQRATAQVNAENAGATAAAESRVRATAEANAIAESQVRATAQAVAEEQKQVAIEQRNLAISRQLAAQSQSLLDNQLDLALLLGIQSNELSNDVDARNSLLSGIVHVPYLERILATGQNNDNQGIAFSPDGQFIASGIQNQIWLFDAKTGLRVAQYRDGDLGQVDSVAFDPSGKLLAAGHLYGAITFWNRDLPSDQTPRILNGHVGRVNSLVFSPDGTRLASGSSDDSKVMIWEVETGLPAHVALSVPNVTAIAFSPDGKLLATGDQNDLLRLWDPNTGMPLGEPLNSREFWGKDRSLNNFWISGIAFSPDGSQLAVAASLGVAVIDLANRQATNPPPDQNAPQCQNRTIAFLPVGREWVSSGCNELVVKTTDTNETVLRVQGHFADIDALAPSPDGKSLATSGPAGYVLQWTLENSPWVIQNRTPGSHEVFYVTRDEKLGLSAQSACEQVSCPADGPEIRSRVRAWNGKDEAQGTDLGIYPGRIDRLAISPSGKYLAGASDTSPGIVAKDLSIPPVAILWDLERQEVLETLKLPGGYTLSGLAFDPSGTKLVVSGCADHPQPYSCDQGFIQLWDVPTGNPIGEPVIGHAGNIDQLIYSPDGNELATAGRDGLVKLWNAVDLTPVETITLPGGSMVGAISLVFNPEGSLLATGTNQGVIYLWKAGSYWTLLGTLDERSGDALFQGMITSLAFSPDSKLLAAANVAGTAFLWDVATLRPVGPPIHSPSAGNGGAIANLVFGPSGETLFTPGSAGETTWDLAPSTWRTAACQLANRNFTAAEWKQYFPGEPYALVCPNSNLEAGVFDLASDQAGISNPGGDPKAVADFYTRMLAWASGTQSLDFLNLTCWFGSLDGAARQVLPACDQAVSLSQSASARDGRALARALTGDFPGAIEDFRAFSNWLRANGHEEEAAQRDNWITALSQGENPFTPAVVDQLLNP